MKYVLLLILLSGCALTPPNDPICFQDGPSNANCSYMVVGTDFKVDNLGHNYTLNSHNWNFDQLRQNSLWVPPETYGDIKEFFLKYCNQNQSQCNYQSFKAALDKFEKSLKGK